MPRAARRTILNRRTEPFGNGAYARLLRLKTLAHRIKLGTRDVGCTDHMTIAALLDDDRNAIVRQASHGRTRQGQGQRLALPDADRTQVADDIVIGDGTPFIFARPDVDV